MWKDFFSQETGGRPYIRMRPHRPTLLHLHPYFMLATNATYPHQLIHLFQLQTSVHHCAKYKV